MPPIELPRLTGSLRAFSGLSSPFSRLPESDDILKRKRQLRSKNQLEKTLSWSELKGLILDATSFEKNASQEVKTLLKELVLTSAEIAGKDSSVEIVESASVLIFTTFKEVTHIGKDESAKLKSFFGAFPASAATKACHITQNIILLLPEDCVAVINKRSEEKYEETPKEFGSDIEFAPFKTKVVSPDDELFSDSEDENVENQMDFWIAKEENNHSKDVPKEEVNGNSDFNGSWLHNQCELYFGNNSSGLSVLDLCSALFDILSSARDNAAIQNDLFELLGFDHFEFIQTILANRYKIVVATSESTSDLSAANETARVKTTAGQSKPTYGCQVTVQSQQEKQLMRQVRKEERKEERRQARRDKNAEEQDIDHETYLKEVGFDPELMRAQRELALQAAISVPLLSKPKRNVQSSQVYPYVFDALAERQRSTAFISDTKITLPADAKRKNTKICEEVVIPPNTPLPPKEETPISISSLDEIGQMGFQGVKRLNRIQSIVFDAAYNTNENLLISAPTGAGKTNIAMLTILREIKQNIVAGVIKKDKFKIIYVAPMKALAAEMVQNFGKRLASLGITVRELTGDMQLTKSEILKTQMLVTTPEKWDVVTRKSTGDVALAQQVKLLIIDEVHLLHDDRGSVIECLVARTLRQVESSQSMIRIVGLSATLPNYIDVAHFLRVNPFEGLFFFDGRFRPVPLGQTFIGIKAAGYVKRQHDMDTVCYDKVLENVDKGHQVMVFVHARNATVKTALTLREMAANQGDSALFHAPQGPEYGQAEKQVMKSRNKQLRELFPDGFSIHHAGMLRQDRTMVEQLFARGLIRVLVCTATLAWGVNLPAHAVIIKGTQVYDAKKGSFVDIGILDVLQIFGRAGRPQFDNQGEGIIITAHDKLSHYLSLLTRQSPIESQFISSLTDSLNAEIALGTVGTVDEAVEWLSYTYLYIRMRVNPLVYGIAYGTKEDDPLLLEHRRELIVNAARHLDKAKMIRFDPRTGYLNSTDLGRTASHFYIKYDTIEVFNEMFKAHMPEPEVLSMMSHSQEFEQVKVREDEISELEFHLSEHCPLPVKGGVENNYGKINILLQTFISKGFVDTFSLVSDLAYVAQNAARLMRGLFEIALNRGWPTMAYRLLGLCKMLDKRQWVFENPLRQFTILKQETLVKLEERKATVDRLRDMTADEIGHMIRHPRMGSAVKSCVEQIPAISLATSIQPITRTVLRVRVTIKPEFRWNDKVHGSTSEPWWIWVEDPDNNHIYHSEYFLLHKKQVLADEEQTLVFTIPIFEPLPSQYLVRGVSDRWLGSEVVCALSFKHLILPEKHPPHTELLDLQPLPLTALKCKEYEALYRFTHFNPVQTQVFHTVYHTDHNVLLGAPTGSGKTLVAELAIFRIFNVHPGTKAVYIAPLKALVRERMEDWKIRFQEKLGRSVVELTGDVTPDMRAIAKADVIVTTPEKWDGISRSWQTRNYVQSVSLLVIDEIHLLGEERGPVLEVIVSRTNFISSHTEKTVRVIGLSTALANASDLADWLGIEQAGMFNFRPSVRPVPLEVHISGYPGKHYCPRMATMNKPTFNAIKTHSPTKPVLVFVSSRRQTRLTALELISFLAAEDNPKQWMQMPEAEMDSLIQTVKDNNLKLTLSFGIALHHAGLHERDRKIAEELFVNQKIQILIATSTLAWGVNFPAHLVVVKGTEYYDGKTRRYVDFPITDVLQMMGRAGRPQYDENGVAVILVHDIKKHFYKKFLYEPFPVESSLLEVLPDHLNAEIVAGTITSKQDAMDYLTWTYFFRRLLMNPSYYDLENIDNDSVNKFLSALVEGAVREVENSACVEIGEDGLAITPTNLGRISSYYYLNHLTLRMFHERLDADCSLPDLIEILADAEEYTQLPVRHNEDIINSDLAPSLPLEVDPHTFDSPHTKAHLLFQAHFTRLPLPSTDYLTDTNSVLDQAIRILQAMIDVSSAEGWLATALRCMHLVQMVVQGRWLHDCTLLTLPCVDTALLSLFRINGRSLECLPELLDAVRGDRKVLNTMLGDALSPGEITEIFDTLGRLPQISVKIKVRGVWAENERGAKESKPISTTPTEGLARDWVPLHAEQEYVLILDITKELCGFRRSNTKAHAPHFPKGKDVGWWVVLGEMDTGELLAVIRVSQVRSSSTVSLSFYTPEDLGRRIYTVFLISDAYLGIDQQYDVSLEIIQSDVSSHVITEVNFSD
ncbi:activating signal cointegrator 1 complex subunit 3-like [Stylophora pistillata]|uniref:Activating signal cointegrator 1 complex subunit 3 n=1 Tax=Stylophora pistillata TaxID=50429 RepID=A0A2B4S355_STYPI|nr:activating signal cointegrator 1 complex subunit 3-like [Stylophora pistillata]PFX22952.1 Activating signal cointegrator 1 complex subunit 3 [Stylophora pistillata]